MRKIVLLRWGVGAVCAGSVTGGAVSGARFGVLRLGEGRVPSTRSWISDPYNTRSLLIDSREIQGFEVLLAFGTFGTFG